MIKLFTDFALGLVGHAKGGAAKVAVVPSSLMGTISGFGVANVVTTGQSTIPLMKRFGYKSAFAGGVEATSSMCGQLMPDLFKSIWRQTRWPDLDPHPGPPLYLISKINLSRFSHKHLRCRRFADSLSAADFRSLATHRPSCRLIKNRHFERALSNVGAILFYP